MKIETITTEIPLAEQAAEILGASSENVMVSKGEDGIEVVLGILDKTGFKVTSDVPAIKLKAIKTWAMQALKQIPPAINKS